MMIHSEGPHELAPEIRAPFKILSEPNENSHQAKTEKEQVIETKASDLQSAKAHSTSTRSEEKKGHTRSITQT